MRYRVMPRWFKQTIAIAGLLLALPGLFIGFGVLCLALILVINSDTDAIYAGLIGVTLILLTAGTGGATFWHCIASLNGKVSKPLRPPPLRGLIGIFVLSFVKGVIIHQSDFVTGLFLPPVLLVAVAAPPLIAVVWITGGQMDGLTWRLSILAFAGAATLSLILFLAVQFVILVSTSMLSSSPADAMISTIELVIEGLFERNGISGMLSRRFIYTFVQITLIIPLIGAMAKPLVTLPLLEQLSRREAFLIGAIAGAGFAALESLLLMNFGLRVWTWILIIQTLGAAIHPLGSGLLALGWWGVVRGKPNAWSNWWVFFGIAVALHSLWSLGFLLIISGSSLVFLVRGPTSILILVALFGLAIGTPWAGRSIGRELNKAPAALKDESVANQPPLFERSMAVWALACLIAILPVGIVGLKNLLR